MLPIDPQLMLSLAWVGVPLCLLFGFVLLVFRIRAASTEQVAARVAEVLKVYADRGEEPPAGVTNTLLALVGGTGDNATATVQAVKAASAAPAPPKPPLTRTQHLASCARDVVLACGTAWIAWWRSPGPAEHPGGLMTLAVIAALAFAAGAVWHLVTALQMRDGG